MTLIKQRRSIVESLKIIAEAIEALRENKKDLEK